MLRTLKAVLAVVLAVVTITSISSAPGLAAPQDYRFEVLGQPIKAAHDASFSVQLSQLPSGKAVANATITQEKLHMIMGTMDMPIAVKRLPSDDTGTYRFSADLSMYGAWTLDLVATVPDEKEPLTTSVKLLVTK